MVHYSLFRPADQEVTLTENQAPENKLRQIRRLLDLAADERTAEVERERAMNKATELMANHGVTEMMLNAYSRTTTDEIISKPIRLGNPYSSQKSTLLAWIANALTCKTVTWNHGREYHHAEVTGFRSDVERVELLYTSLLLQMFNGAQNVQPNHWDTTPTATFRKNWMEGFASHVSHRIAVAEKAARDSYDREHTGTGGPGTALVVVERRTLVEKTFAAKYPRLRKAAKIKRSSRSGRYEGGQAGKRADIGGAKIGENERPALTAR